VLVSDLTAQCFLLVATETCQLLMVPVAYSARVHAWSHVYVCSTGWHVMTTNSWISTAQRPYLHWDFK